MDDVKEIAVETLMMGEACARIALRPFYDKALQGYDDRTSPNINVLGIIQGMIAGPWLPAINKGLDEVRVGIVVIETIRGTGAGNEEFALSQRLIREQELISPRVIRTRSPRRLSSSGGFRCTFNAWPTGSLLERAWIARGLKRIFCRAWRWTILSPKPGQRRQFGRKGRVFPTLKMRMVTKSRRFAQADAIRQAGLAQPSGQQI